MKQDMVAGLLVRDYRLLLHNIKHGPVRIEPPGGKKHPQETWEQATERELWEEVGMRARVLGLFGTYDTSSPKGEFLIRMYWCEGEGEPLIREPRKHQTLGWYSCGQMEEFQRTCLLAPNLVAALPQLRTYL